MAKGPNKKMVNRATVVLTVFVSLLLVVMTGYMAYYQIIKHDFYQAKAITQQTMDTEINANRGTIFDRNGVALALSATVETVFISPASVKDDEQARLIASRLSEILDVDEETIYKKAQKTNYYEVIKRKVEKDVADEVRKFIDESKVTAVHLVEDTKRYYPYGSLASHVIGFVGTDNIGLDGVEDVYNEYLQGVNGKLITAKNASGTELPFEYETYIEAKNGNDVTLTIDATVQHYLEKHIENARQENKCLNGAAAMIMDVKTGGILGMVSKPDYDLNNYYEVTDSMLLEGLSKLTGDQLETETDNARNTMWRNKLIVDTYEPGSTFKIITSSVAVEENIVSDSDSFYCPGYYRVAGTTIRCWKHGGHGSQNFAEAIQNSCNPAFMMIGGRIGSELFYKYIKNFGLMEKTGIDLNGEASGIFHTKENFNEVELATTSFGQTFKITPLQMLTAVCAAANDGYLVTPHVVKEITSTDADGNTKTIKSFESNVKRQVISKETSEKVCELLEQAVKVGSGKNAYVKGYRVAGKTGTSEKIDEKNEEGVADKRIASFIGFAPANDPQVAILVMLDEPSAGEVFGGVIAAPVAGDILADVLPYLGINPQYTEQELASLDITTPTVTGITSDEAIQKLTQKNISYRVVGGEGEVEQQMPKAGTSMPQGGTVILYTNGQTPSSNIVVPDLTGLSLGEAGQRLKSAGLNMRIVGNESTKSTAKVFSQTPAAGSVVESGTVVTVKFKNYDDVSN